ncbi:MAG: twin-arginine translocation signal domain-containing protein [Alphaproteobacteria bacterium]|nr:MAG: twin-arginine translocation signal domain-containing protein [Alphaproteobacteria bacterium]
MSDHDQKSTTNNRRRFLKTAGVGTVAAASAVAMPNVSRAQTVVWRFQSTWPQRDIFHEFAQDYVRRVNEMSGGRMRLDLLAAGAVVGAFQLIDAVSAGALDGGHGVAAYWYGKNKAASLFGTAAPFGWTANELLGWIHYGGGQALYDELMRTVLRMNTQSFFYGPMPTQPLGWFRREVSQAEQMRGLRYRTVGLAADLYQAMGVAVTIIPGGEIVPAMDRGLIDAAEFNNPSSDRVLGFPDVSKLYYLQSYHQALECFEVMFNRTKFDALPAELKSILRYAAEASSSDMAWKAMDRYSKDLTEMRERQGVRTVKTSDAILQSQLRAWDTVINNLSQDAFFKRVVDSQRAWSQRVVGFRHEYEVSSETAYAHFFPRRG